MFILKWKETGKHTLVSSTFSLDHPFFPLKNASSQPKLLLNLFNLKRAYAYVTLMSHQLTLVIVVIMD